MIVGLIVVASCKHWHRAGFELMQSEAEIDCVWVSTPAELDDVVANSSIRYIFFLHWNWYVSEDIWSNIECVCFHMSDLPFGRGGSPLQNLILKGRKNTKLTALKMNSEFDAGPVYAKRSMSLHGRAEEIYLRGGELSWELIRWIIRENPLPEPQHGEVVQFKRRTPDQSVLPSSINLESIFDFIRMLDAPTYPLAFIDHGNFRIEFSHAEKHDDEIRAKVVIRELKVRED